MARSIARPTRAASACADTLWCDSLVSTTLFVHGRGEQAPINRRNPSWTTFLSWSDRRTMQSGHAHRVILAVYTQTRGMKGVSIRLTWMRNKRHVGRDVWT
jgi:hypothetical protein